MSSAMIRGRTVVDADASVAAHLLCHDDVIHAVGPLHEAAARYRTMIDRVVGK